jgi:hypothetical protein
LARLRVPFYSFRKLHKLQMGSNSHELRKRCHSPGSGRVGSDFSPTVRQDYLALGRSLRLFRGLTFWITSNPFRYQKHTSTISQSPAHIGLHHSSLTRLFLDRLLTQALLFFPLPRRRCHQPHLTLHPHLLQPSSLLISSSTRSLFLDDPPHHPLHRPPSEFPHTSPRPSRPKHYRRVLAHVP